jgi:hypothetical protein
MGEQKNPPELIIKEFKPAGRIEALMDYNLPDEWLLVQLNLKNDSLFNLVNDVLPEIELFSGPASYHRIIQPHHVEQIQNILTNEYFFIIDENYQIPTSSREFWIDVKQGSEVQGTWSDDDAIEYTCSCLSGASDCVKLGWDESWWNPLDYWGEAWYGYAPPSYQSIEEIRVVVRGGQCDDLPLWSETYMGMMDDNGNWSHDYELSINYTDNEYIVGNIWSGSMLMPRIGSEDNYCIDTIRLKFYYTCDEPDSPTDLMASNAEDCFTVNLTWNLPESSIIGQTLYRDDIVIAQLDYNEVIYEDWGAQSGIEHTYCIESQNECGTSIISCTYGSLRTEPDAPEDVSATDGNYSNQVLINWTSTMDTDQYKIYRDGSWMGFVAPDVLEYTDIIPELGIFYEYCIEAINVCGESEWECDIGYTAEAGGDVNADGSIDVLDVVVVVNIILGEYEPTNDELSNSDINSDGEVDVLDVVMITNTILGG